MHSDKIILFKYYSPILTIIIVIQILCFFLINLHISFFGITTTASGILFPIDIYLFEIIGYCYSYEYARHAIWNNSLAQVVLLIGFKFFSHFHFTAEQNEYVAAYHIIFKYSFWIILGSLVGEFIGDLFSARIVPRLKVIAQGKYTLLIILFVHLLAEFFTIFISYNIIFLPENKSFVHVFHLVLGTIFVKSCIAILSLPFVKIIIKLIKKHEGFDMYDENQDYKLFKFSPDLNKIKFINCAGVYKNEKDLYNK